MKFTMLGHVNTRTAGGRQFSAMEGATSEVPDDDTDMCDAIREQAARGLVRIHEPETEPAEVDEPPTAQVAPATPPRKAATVQRGPRGGRGA